MPKLMNKCINLLAVLVIVLTSAQMTAQNSDNPWMISAGFNFVGLDNKDLLDLSVGVLLMVFPDTSHQEFP